MPKPTPLNAAWIEDDTLLLHCLAKVNLALSVGAPRGDGMHPIASWMVPIALSDTLTMRRTLGSGGPYVFDITFAEGAPTRQPVDWPLESDLAYRALNAVEVYTRRDLPVTVTLEKRIPAGAGLGGGSADAAGMLVGLNALYGLQLDSDALMQIASELGSDVMFQLKARLDGTGAIVSGIGERIEPLQAKQPTPLLLILPPFGCSTPAVYRAFDEDLLASESRAPDTDRVRRLAHEPLLPPTALFNDLAKPACAVQPGLQDIIDRAHVLGLSPHVTGSGSAVFCVLDSTMPSREVQARIDQLKLTTGCAVLTTQTLG